MNDARASNPSNNKNKASRDPSNKGDVNPVRPASAPDIADFGGYTGYRGYTSGKHTENKDFRHGAPVTPGSRATGYTGYSRLDFAAINAAALRDLPALLARWLPDGRMNGREYTARNPRRADRHPGSFRVNMRNGRWADFATGDRGGDPVSLAAFLFNLSQIEAARRLADMLGVH